MNMQEIKERARVAGVPRASRLRKSELIQAIQRQEGNQPCFGADWRKSCGQHDCCWHRDCRG